MNTSQVLFASWLKMTKTTLSNIFGRMVYTTISDLGVVSDTKMGFISHIRKVTSKADIALETANILVKWMWWRYYSMHSFILRFPSYICYIAEIELIQKKFLKYLVLKDGTCSQRDSDYTLLLERFEMRVSSKHISQSPFLVYKISQSKVDSPIYLDK